MTTITPSDEFDAARNVVALLKPLRPDEQARALRWAQEKLGALNPQSVSGDVPRSEDSNAAEGPSHELTGVLRDPTFRRHSSAVDKLLHLLSVALQLKPDAAQKLLLIQGRGRRYFAETEIEITRSGNSTQPRRIPNSALWVMTNSPTPQKRALLGKALALMGFSAEAIKAALATMA